MKQLHLGALACFVIALLFYLLSWSQHGFTGFVLLGGLFELAAWVKLLRPRKNTP